MNDLAITEYVPNTDYAGWEKLHEAAFPRPESLIKRKHYIKWLEANPVPGNLYISVYSNSKLVGFLGLLSQRIGGRNREFLAAQAVGAMTDPEFQGRGIYTAMASKAFELTQSKGFDFCLGYTVHEKVLALELRIGWRKISEGYSMALPLRFGPIVAHIVPKLAPASSFLRPLDNIQNFIVNCRTRRKSDIPCLDIRSGSGFGDEYDRLARSSIKGDVYTIIKDSKYLQWKYLSEFNPFQYDLVEAYLGQELLGAVIGRPMMFESLKGYAIIDILVGKGCDYVTGPLIRNMISECAILNEPELIGCMISPNSPAYSQLRKLGFFRSARPFSLIIHPCVSSLPAEMMMPDGWMNCWGNNDTV